jgi:hypothetical protein
MLAYAIDLSFAASNPNLKVFANHQRVLIDTSIWIYHFEQNPSRRGRPLKSLSGWRTGSFVALLPN